MRIVPLLGLLSLPLLACSPDDAGSPFPEARSSLARDLSPQVSEAARRQTAQDNAEFAMALFKHSVTPDQNAMQAPLSLSTALAMTFAGAAGETATEMATALHFTVPPAELHPAFNWLDQQLTARAAGATGKDGKPARVRSDNLVFSVPELVAKAPFLDTLAVHYGAGVQLADLGTPAALDRINEYVAERTEERVPKLLGTLPAGTVMVLVNTVYVNAAWATPFVRDATRDRSFATPVGARDVPFMQTTFAGRYVDTSAFTAVEIPLAVPGLAMDVVLPKAGLAAFETGASGASLNELFTSMTAAGVNLSLPKFKLEPKANGSVVAPLRALGMNLPFTAAADFSAMSDSFPLQIGEVVHKTFFEIDEDGLEAAGASAVAMTRSAGAMAEVELVVDRPFLVVLRDVETGNVLFLGHVVDPSSH